MARILPKILRVVPMAFGQSGQNGAGPGKPSPGPQDSCQPTAQARNRRLGQGCEKGGTRPRWRQLHRGAGSTEGGPRPAPGTAHSRPFLMHPSATGLTHEETSLGLQGRAPLPGSAFLRGTGASISYCLGNLSAHLTELE